MNPHLKKRQGFTLVELAVVLVIIGLVVGGVLTGQDLIRAVERQAIVTEKERFAAAFYAFRGKYGAQPGDMRNAYQYFGDDCGTDTTDLNTGCNGNGNLIIQNMDQSGENAEHLKAWEHLSRAGLIAGTYDGTGVVANWDATTAWASPENSPASRFPKSYWVIDSEPANSMVRFQFYLHFIGFDYPNSAPFVPSPSLTHGDALVIDMKVDDGRANSGALAGDGGADCSDDGTDSYSVIRMGKDYSGDCALHFSL